MRILLSWLRELVDVPEGATELASALTMRGFQLASIDAAPGGARSDAVLDLEVTTNRPDCLSVLGIAREVSAMFDRPLRANPAVDALAGRPQGRPGEPERHPDLTVTLLDSELCPRYAAAVADVTVGPSPGWLATRLHAAGLRAINNVVDVTNYVLIELGHPLHPFDLDRLAGSELQIRRARPGESIRTLDGQDHRLTEDMLVIADARRPQAVAGVMGGADSEVHVATRRVALESAYFHPRSVRQTSRRLNLKTEASARFERGANVAAPVVALERACELLERIGAGRARGSVIDRYPAPGARPRLTLRRDRIARLIGVRVDDAEVRRILARLGFEAEAASDGGGPAGWSVVVPPWRADVTREADLIEEIARHHGYDRIPATFPPLAQMPGRPDPRIERDRLVRRILTAAGFTEAVTFSFIDRVAAAALGVEDEAVPIANPLSEKFTVLRPTLLAGVVDAIIHNRRRQREDVRLFEVGDRFSTTGGETRGVALGWAGAGSLGHWSARPRPADLFDVTGLVSRLCGALAGTPEFEPLRRSGLVEGGTAAIRVDGTSVGVAGLVDPAVTAARGLPSPEDVFVAELDLDALERVSRAPRPKLRAAQLPRHPSVVRDISIVVDDALPAAAVRETIWRAAARTLVQLREFDRYRGPGVPEGRISLSLRLTFQSSDRTLTDVEVQQAVEDIVAVLASAHGAQQR